MRVDHHHNHVYSIVGEYLELVTINSNEITDTLNTLHYVEHYSFLLSDTSLPKKGKNYVYLQISHSNPNFTYIGQTENIVWRCRQHQSGNGAIGTADPVDQPCYVVAYITGLIHCDITQRMSLEAQW